MAAALFLCMVAFVGFTVFVLKLTYRLDHPPSRLHDCLIEVGGCLLVLTVLAVGPA